VICAHREEKHFGSLASVDFCGAIHPWQVGSWFGCSLDGVSLAGPVERESLVAGQGWLACWLQLGRLSSEMDRQKRIQISCKLQTVSIGPLLFRNEEIIIY